MKGDLPGSSAGAERLPFRERLGTRVVLSLTVLLALVMMLSMGIQLQQQRRSIMQEEETRADFMAEGLLASLQTLMLTGNGPLARDWLERVSKETGVLKAEVVRRNGNEAFLDLKTIHQVNRFLGNKVFARPALPAHTVTDIPATKFRQAVAGHRVSIRDEDAGHLTYLLPIKKLNACNACHGYDASPIRGVLRITTSLKHAEDAITQAHRKSIGIGIGATLLLAISLFFLIRRQVTQPIQALYDTARRIDEGDFSASAPIRRRDEIGRLGMSFNHMTRRLVDHIAESKALSDYYLHLLDGLSNGVVVYDGSGSITYVNARMLAITGYSRDEYKRLSYKAFYPASERSHSETGFRKRIERLLKKVGSPYAEITTRKRKDGSEWIARISLIPLRDDEGGLQELIEISEDITEDRQRQEEIGWLSSIPELNPFPIIEVDGNSAEVLYMNPATLEYLKLHNLSADRIDEILPEDFREAVNICREENISIDTVSFEVGDEIMIWQLHPNANNNNVRAYAIDVTNQVRAEQEAMHLAQHDTLTGLPNRLLFFDRLEQAIAQAKRNNRKIAVLMVDLDRFKPINDELGHDAGDEALREIAHRLLNCLRETDTAARFGGDEFAVVLTNLHEAGDAERVASQIVKELARPIRIAGQDCIVGASIGIAVSTGNTTSDEEADRWRMAVQPDHAAEGDILLNCADQAMYAAKEAGRNTYRVYNQLMEKLS